MIKYNTNELTNYIKTEFDNEHIKALNEFLNTPENINLIENKNFQELYEKLDYTQLTPLLTAVLLLSGINDLLSYLTYAHEHLFRGLPIIEIIIPANCTEISNDVFNDCYELTSVVLPDTITDIRRSAFFDCAKLNSISYLGTKEQWENIDKSLSWKVYSNIKTIKCEDGDIEL